MIVAGLDLSMSCTGLVVYETNTYTVLAYETISTKKDANLDWFLDCAKRSKVIAKKVEALCSLHKVTHVIIESPSLGSKGNATRTMPMLTGVVLGVLTANYKYALLGVPPTTLKKAATGKGNATKEQMLDCVPSGLREKFSKLPKSNGRYDLADAYHLATFTLKK